MEQADGRAKFWHTAGADGLSPNFRAYSICARAKAKHFESKGRQPLQGRRRHARRKIDGWRMSMSRKRALKRAPRERRHILPVAMHDSTIENEQRAVGPTRLRESHVAKGCCPIVIREGVDHVYETDKARSMLIMTEVNIRLLSRDILMDGSSMKGAKAKTSTKHPGADCAKRRINI